MGSKFISDPMDFTYKEGNAVDFKKTFDLTGSDNDQMLRVYLSKAGLSDNIDHLTPQERKAFIYDIVKSNKDPGYWKPSVLLKESPNTMQHKRTRSTETRLEPAFSDSLPSLDDIPQASVTFDYNQFSQNNSVSTIQDMGLSSEGQQPVRGILYERQFQQQKIYNAPPTPPSPSIFVTRKGRTMEIGAPTNFRHVSGDMTRDMSKNAFDLAGQFNDKSLKKYMIERGITEDDIAGMDRKELIKTIVQSKYTWMPPNRRQYSGNTIPPPPSEVYMVPTPPVRHRQHNKGVAMKVSGPQIPSDTPYAEEEIYLEILPPDSGKVSKTERAAIPPPPLPITSFVKPPSKPPTPPPPTPIKHSKPVRTGRKANQAPLPPPPPPPMPNVSSSADASVLPPPPPPPPPPMPIVVATSGVTVLPPQLPLPPITSSHPTIPSQPPSPVGSTSSGGVPPPPPPPVFAPSPAVVSKTEPQNKTKPSGDDRGALLESIRTGVTLKRVNKQNHARPELGAIIDPTGQEPIQPTEVAKEKPIKSEPQDFMAELRNATLKRIKKLENNPYAEDTSESHC